METAVMIQNIMLVFGGLGLFLYGMKMLIDGLEVLAGNRMRAIVEKATSNRFFGVGVGALVTIIIQSSTATSVIAVGFINAGLMKLAQAISIIIGAHIGTTLTAHVIAFRVDTAAPVFIFIGLVMYLFIKQKGPKDFGFVMLGVGLLFFGLSVMSEPLRLFAMMDGFQYMLTAFRNPVLAILAGFVFTAIIQSSTAATGILVLLMLSEGVEIEFTTAAYLILGISVGTTITALLASLAGRRESKRLALANVIYISIGSIFFGTVIQIFPVLLYWFQTTWGDPGRQLAMFYTFFKGALTILFLPFIGYLANLMYVIMPKRIYATESNLEHIKTADSHTPSVAISQSFDELGHMGRLALGNMKLALDAFNTGDVEKIKAVNETEGSIKFLSRQISSLLKAVDNVETVDDIKKIGTLMYIVNDLEKIGDYAKSITEYKIHTKKGNLRLSEKALEELNLLSRATINIIALTMELFNSLSEEILESIYHLERHIDNIAKEYMENHIQRLKNEKTNTQGGVIFINMVTNLERCADHANSIAYYLTEISKFGTKN